MNVRPDPSPDHVDGALALYYECHVTVDQESIGDKMEILKDLAADRLFRVSEIVETRWALTERHTTDTICTSRGRTYDALWKRMQDLMSDLRAAGFKIYRYKIEATVLDEKEPVRA